MALYMYAPLATALGSTDGAVHVCGTAAIRKDLRRLAISRDRTHTARGARTSEESVIHQVYTSSRTITHSQEMLRVTARCTSIFVAVV